jgi:ubiquinone/menaquinone biosynthesis C-methylase UbiE
MATNKSSREVIMMSYNDIPAASPRLSDLAGRESEYYRPRARYYAGRKTPSRTMKWYVEEEYFEEIVRLSRIAKSSYVLDVNTGNPISGVTAIYLQVAAPGARVVGIDKAKPLVTAAKENAEQMGVRSIVFEEGYEEDLSQFGSNEFDIVVDRLGFHHNKRPSQALAEISRVLKPEGLFIFSDIVAPNEPAAQSWINRVWSRHDSSHVEWYRADQIESFLTGAGFKAQERTPWLLPMHMDEIGWFSDIDRQSTQKSLMRATPEQRDIFKLTGTDDDMTIVLDMTITAYTKSA